jgi:hypothetical protein
MAEISQERLRQITGYKRRADQIRWLKEHGITPFVGADGTVTVFEDVLEEAQRRASGMELQAARRQGPRPNLRAVT